MQFFSRRFFSQISKADRPLAHCLSPHDTPLFFKHRLRCGNRAVNHNSYSNDNSNRQKMGKRLLLNNNNSNNNNDDDIIVVAKQSECRLMDFLSRATPPREILPAGKIIPITMRTATIISVRMVLSELSRQTDGQTNSSGLKLSTVRRSMTSFGPAEIGFETTRTEESCG